MSTVVFYKEHTSYRRVLYGICSSNDVGEVRKFSPCQSLTPDSFLFLTALQVYCRTYKQAPFTPLGLFRRPHRLDQLLPSTVSDDSKSISNEAENYTCSKCKTPIAPRSYNEKNPVSGENVRTCHRCYYGKKEHSKDVVGSCDSLRTSFISIHASQAPEHLPIVTETHMSIKFCCFSYKLSRSKKNPGPAQSKGLAGASQPFTSSGSSSCQCTSSFSDSFS